MHKKIKYSISKKKFLIAVRLVFLLALSGSAHAQVMDTLKTTGPRDTVILKKQINEPSPRKAAIYSTILPGLGQAYNKKYWKIPILYAGIAGLTYSIIYNNNNYLTYRSAYRIRKDTDPTTVDQFVGILNDDYLLQYTKSFHRWRDLSIFGAALLYALNVVDATVDAHLSTFDVSDDLSLRIQPVFYTTAEINKPGVKITGLSVHLNF